MKNLKEFWSCQQYSGADPELFLSQEAAHRAYTGWVGQVNKQVAKYWEDGDKGNLVWESRLESDSSGGCYQSFIPHDCNYPGAIYHYPVGSQAKENWETCKGAELIPWGNPATARV